MNSNGLNKIDYTHKDYASLREAMLELAREKLPAWTDHSPNDLGVAVLELFAFMGDSLFYYMDRLVNESYLTTAVERRSVMHLLQLIGGGLKHPLPSSADLTLLFDAGAAGLVTIPAGATFKTKAEATGESIRFDYLRDPVTIDLNALTPITHTDGQAYKRFMTLPVVQVDAAVTGEVIGSSDGSPGQRYALARSPFVDGTLIVDVDDGSGLRAWQQVDTLLNSAAGDTHYIVQRDEKDVAWVEFGDNQYGLIPRRGHDNLRAEYRIGGGLKGNVSAFTIVDPVTAIGSLALVFNEQPATGGTDAEALAEAVRRAPKLFRAMDRAVTARDYEEHAMQFGVGKARARTGSWNRIELFVAPVGGGQPSDTLKEDLRNYFEDKRIMTALLDVRDPDYINVFVEGTLEVEAYYFSKQVQQQTENAISALLAFEAVRFQDKLYLSKLYEAIEAIEGVKGVNVTRFARSDSVENLPADGTLAFGWSEIPHSGYSAGIKLTVIGGRSDS